MVEGCRCRWKDVVAGEGSKARSRIGTKSAAVTFCKIDVRDRDGSGNGGTAMASLATETDLVNMQIPP